MNFIKFLRATAIFTIVLVTFQEAEGQYAYALSDIVYDNVTKKVTSLSRTRLDFIAGLHYDPAVVGGMFQEGSFLGAAQNTGFADIVPAVVRLRTTFQSPPDTRFDVLSDHYIVAYFYTEVIIYGDDGEILGRQWYDPLGFSAFGGGANPGWKSYMGSNRVATYVDYQYFRIGRTGRGVIANPTVCTPASMAAGAVSDSCPIPLTVRITNEFKPGQDLSEGGHVQQAMLGKVQMEVETLGGTSEPITYNWTSDVPVGVSCSTGRICLANLDKPTTGDFNTITVSVNQGS